MSNQVQDNVDTEVYIEYGIGFMILLVRLAGRTVVHGFGGLAWDDLCTFAAMVRIRLPALRSAIHSTKRKYLTDPSFSSSSGRPKSYF